MVSRATKSVRSWFSPEQACQYLAQQLNCKKLTPLQVNGFVHKELL